MKKMSIVIVDHSASFIKHLQEILETDDMEVIATLSEQSNIVTTLNSLQPDVILIDITLIDNYEKRWTNKIVHELNIPMIIISSTKVQDSAKTINAITSGASDYILRNKIIEPLYVKEMLNKIKNIRRTTSMKESAQSKSKKTHQKSTIKQQQRKVRNEYKNKQEYTGPTSFHTVVAIGTSTGGPKALQKVLLNIPRNFPYPILIVQHMPSGFTNSLAYRLNETCNIRVKEAEDGDVLQGGTAYIAPGDYHMAVTSNQKIQIYQEEERQGHRPSVNILLESLANLKNVNKLVVILTGMGKDGSEGLKKLKEADPDVYVIAESEETAVIYGMPKAALETGYVNEILKLEEIGEKIISYAMKRGI